MRNKMINLGESTMIEDNIINEKYLVIITIARSGHHDTNNYGNWTWDTSGLELQWFDWLQDEPNDYHTQKYQRNEKENSATLTVFFKF